LYSFKSLKLYSLNPIYKPYDLNLNEIKEIWKFTNFISKEIPDPQIHKDDLLKTVSELQYEMNKVKETLKI